MLLPQEGHLFSGTIADNVRLARPEATDEEVVRALDEIGARERFELLPDGIHTDVQSRGVRLSAGERQLVGIARVALADPAVIVLDEATSSLDPATEAAVEQALAAVAAGRTVITIAHRLSTAERADRVVVMDAGEVVEVASHDELVRQGERYARLWAAGKPASPPAPPRGASPWRLRAAAASSRPGTAWGSASAAGGACGPRPCLRGRLGRLLREDRRLVPPASSRSNWSLSIVSRSIRIPESRWRSAMCSLSTLTARSCPSWITRRIVVDLPRDLLGVVGLGAHLTPEERHVVIPAEHARAELRSCRNA